MKPIFWYTQRFLAFLYWGLSKFWYELEVTGAENLKNLRGPVIIIANHKSMADHFFIGAGFPCFWRSPLLPIRIMAKDALFKNIFSRMFFLAIGTYPAYYGQGIDKSLEKPVRILESGGVVGIYPEGKRIYTDEVGEFKRGIGELSRKKPQVLILPVAIHGNGTLVGELLPGRKSKIKVSYGLPFTPNLHADSLMTAQGIRAEFLKIYETKTI